MDDPNAPSQPSGEPERTSPASGNETGAQPGSSPESAPTQPEDYSKLSQQELLQKIVRLDSELSNRNRDYGASKQEATRLYQAATQLQQERDALAMQVQLAQNQTRQTPAGPVAPAEPRIEDGGLVADSEAEELSNAIIAGKSQPVKQILGTFAKRLKTSWETDLLQRVNQQSEITAAQQALNQTVDPKLWQDPEFTKTTLEAYSRIASDPIRSVTFKEAPMRVGQYNLNANILREAAIEAKGAIGARRATAQDAVRQTSEFFIEPAGAGKTPIPDQGGQTQQKFNADNADHVRKLLSAEELDYCNRRGTDIVNYFKWLPEEVKRARVEQKRPVTSTQLGLRTIR